MNTANAVSEQGYSLHVNLVDAPLEGDVRITFDGSGSLELLEDLEAELRVRDDVGGWAW